MFLRDFGVAGFMDGGLMVRCFLSVFFFCSELFTKNLERYKQNVVLNICDCFNIKEF